MTTRQELIECIQALSRAEGTRQPMADDWLRDQGETPKEVGRQETGRHVTSGEEPLDPKADWG